MNPTAIYSKTGKGVQEASGKTNLLSRADRAVLTQIDGKTNFADLQIKFYKIDVEKLEALILQFDKDGFVREVATSGSQPAPAPLAPAAARPAAAKPAPAAPAKDPAEELDFTAAPPRRPGAPGKGAPPARPPADLAAEARSKAEAWAKEQELLDYRARQEVEAKARAAADAKARADAEARIRAEANAAVKAAQDAAVRAAAEARAKAEGEAKARAEAAEREHQAAAQRERQALERARREAEEKTRLEAELRGKLEAERKAREDSERMAKEEAMRLARESAERERERVEQARREAEELRRQLDAERKAKEEAERRAKEESERKAREESERKAKEEAERKAREAAERERVEQARREAEEKARREAEDLRRELEAERKAKAEAERKAREEAERKARDAAERERIEQVRREAEEKARREADERARREAETLRQQLEVERKAKEDAERRAKEEAERRSREEADRRSADEARKRGEEEARKRSEEEARKRSDDEERLRREREERARKKIEAGMAAAKAEPPPAPQAEPAGESGGSIDSLFADLNTFAQREEEERKAKEAADLEAKQEAERQKAERRKRDEEEARRKAEEERRRREQEERARQEAERAKEEAARRAKEDEEREAREAEERKKKAKESYAAKQAELAQGDVKVKDDDLDLDEIKRDQAALAESRKRERDREREEQRKDAEVVGKGAATDWLLKVGKKAALGLAAALVVAAVAVHVVPLSTADYEQLAAQATGQAVKIGSARLSLVSGLQVKLENVSIGYAAKIGLARASLGIGSLFGAQKTFSRVELENAVIGQEHLGTALLGTLQGADLRIGSVVARQLKLEGPVAVPLLDVEATVAADGTVQSVKINGPERLQGQIAVRNGELTFEVSAGSFQVPFLAGVALADFAMKGTATRQGLGIAEFDGRALEGVFTGNSRIRWGDEWSVEGDLRVRGVNVGVFAPALVSEGKVEGSGKYAMKGPAPAKLGETLRMEGTFKIEKGVLGSFDLGRALQGTGPLAGRTVFNELTAQGLYDKGAVQFRNIAITAGALNAGAGVEIAADGALSGRVIVDLKSARATLNLGGKLKEPALRR